MNTDPDVVVASAAVFGLDEDELIQTMLVPHTRQAPVITHRVAEVGKKQYIIYYIQQKSSCIYYILLYIINAGIYYNELEKLK